LIKWIEDRAETALVLLFTRKQLVSEHARDLSVNRAGKVQNSIHSPELEAQGVRAALHLVL
jgi:hypothetical protein